MGTRPAMQYAILPCLSAETIFIEAYSFIHAFKISLTLFALIKAKLASIVFAPISQWACFHVYIA
jgi:hypothetical protein